MQDKHRRIDAREHPEGILALLWYCENSLAASNPQIPRELIAIQVRQEDIAKFFRIHKRTVERATLWLEGAGYVIRQRAYRRAPYYYRLTPDGHRTVRKMEQWNSDFRASRFRQHPQSLEFSLKVIDPNVFEEN